MKKLNKTELNAVAYKISDSIEYKYSFDKTQHKEIKKTFDDFKKSKDYEVLEKYGFEKSNSILKIIFKNSIGSNFNSCTYNRSKDYIKLEKNLWISPRAINNKPSIEAIERELVIAQIECKSLDELIENVKNKFV